jgi:hypothetical protein
MRPDLLDPLKEVGNQVRMLYTRGVGAVLSEIDALDAAAVLDPVHQVVYWATAGLGNYDDLSIYTVNYDPLIDRELLASQTEVVGGLVTARYVLADEFSGLNEDATAMTLAAGTQPVTAFPPRSEPYGRVRAVDLIHLHGGQHWMRAPSGLVYKAPLAQLRAADAYGRWTRGEAIAVQPAVVLTDQKSLAVLQGPFVGAYARLRHDLTRAHRVVVLGYGFGDEPLNAVLRDGLAGAHPAGAKWLLNRNACAPAAELGVRTNTAAALGVAAAALPDLVLRPLPQITTERPHFFDP